MYLQDNATLNIYNINQSSCYSKNVSHIIDFPFSNTNVYPFIIKHTV